jgi:hypothetical protein
LKPIKLEADILYLATIITNINAGSFAVWGNLSNWAPTYLSPNKGFAAKHIAHKLEPGKNFRIIFGVDTNV